MKDALDSDNYESMKTLLEELQKELYTLGSSVYQQASAAAQSGRRAARAPADRRVRRRRTAAARGRGGRRAAGRHTPRAP